MSWTNLFKSKSSAGKPDPQVRWFGKLPTYPDYYRSQTDEHWAIEFNSWVMKGFEIYQGRLDPSERTRRRLPIGQCVVRLPETQMTVLAAVLDFGGDMRGRPFPMFFYVGVPSETLPGPTSDRVTPMIDVLDRLLDLRSEVVRFMNAPGRFESLFGDRKVDVAGIVDGDPDESWMEAGKATPLTQWLAGARDCLKAKRWEDWLLQVDQMGTGIMEHNSQSFEPTLQFPLAAGIPRDVQVGGWLRWIESRMELRERLASVVLTGDPVSEPGQLSVVARELTAEDFLLLTPLAHSLTFVDSLAARAEPSDDSATDSANQGDANTPPMPDDGRTTSAFADPRTWLDFVQAPARAG